MNYFFFYLFFVGVFIICINDFRTGLIKNNQVILLILYAIILLPFNPYVNWYISLIMTFLMIIIFLLLYSHNLIGGGDIKLFIAITLVTGLYGSYIFALQGLLALLWQSTSKTISFKHVRAGLFILVSTIIILLLYFV